MTTPRHRCRLGVFADYHQFYVLGADTSDRHAPEDWSDQDVADRAKVAPGVVVICPVRNMEVPVEVGICDSDPQAGFAVEPGDYTVRALYRGLDSLSEDGLEGEDFYEVQIWMASCAGLRVIKRWD